VAVPSDNGTPDRPLSDEDTGRISARLHARLAGQVGAASAVTPPLGTPTPEEFLDRLAEKLAARVGNGGGGNGHRRFLGLELGGWTKLLASMILAGAVALAAWWLTVRDELANRTTGPDVHRAIIEAEAHHDRDSEAHPPIQKRLEGIEVQQRTIRDSQIRQEGIDGKQSLALESIAEDVKVLRRQRGR